MFLKISSTVSKTTISLIISSILCICISCNFEEENIDVVGKSITTGNNEEFSLDKEIEKKIKIGLKSELRKEIFLQDFLNTIKQDVNNITSESWQPKSENILDTPHESSTIVYKKILKSDWEKSNNEPFKVINFFSKDKFKIENQYKPNLFKTIIEKVTQKTSPAYETLFSMLERISNQESNMITKNRFELIEDVYKRLNEYHKNYEFINKNIKGSIPLSNINVISLEGLNLKNKDTTVKSTTEKNRENSDEIFLLDKVEMPKTSVKCIEVLISANKILHELSSLQNIMGENLFKNLDEELLDIVNKEMGTKGIIENLNIDIFEKKKGESTYCKFKDFKALIEFFTYEFTQTIETLSLMDIYKMITALFIKFHHNLEYYLNKDENIDISIKKLFKEKIEFLKTIFLYLTNNGINLNNLGSLSISDIANYMLNNSGKFESEKYKEFCKKIYKIMEELEEKIVSKEEGSKKGIPKFTSDIIRGLHTEIKAEL